MKGLDLNINYCKVVTIMFLICIMIDTLLYLMTIKKSTQIQFI